MFLFLLGRCVDAELGDKFMFNLWGNCQPVSQGILHSSLSVWWFCFSTCLLALGVLFWFWLFYCVYHVGWYVNLLALFFFPQAHILTQSVTVLWWYAESTNIPTWAQSPSPLFSVGTFLNLYNPLKFLFPNLFGVHFLPLLILLPSSHWRS